MSATVIRTLHCDNAPCTATVTAPDAQSLHQLRALAFRLHGWSTRGLDLCPAHNPKGGDR